MSKELSAVKTLIKSEITDDYNCKFRIECVGETEFKVIWESDHYKFNDINLKVVELGVIEESSTFSVCTKNDNYGEFVTFDFTVKDLWKALLWQQ